jgi:hypothetical protein
MSTPCPVIQSANQVTGAAADLYKSIRRYHRSKRLCKTCPNAEDCSIKVLELETEIRTSLQTIQDEWSALYDAE